MEKIYNEWLINCLDPILKFELEHLTDEEKILVFSKQLSFGTGGLREFMGVGTNRINIYTIRQATQGIINVIKLKNNSDFSVAIGYDSRNNSTLFAIETATVFLANHIKVYLFDKLRPTPEVSFAVRHLNASLGIVITASHNPKEYNGYKVYNSDGGQITLEDAVEFVSSIKTVNPFKDVNVINTDDIFKNQNLKLLGYEFDEVYLKEVSNLKLLNIPNIPKNSSIVYTPIHGSGLDLVKRSFSKLGFDNIHYLKSQSEPDGNFSTVDSPNPEDPNAMHLAIEYANKIGAELILGTDPDCDRVGVAIKHNDKIIHLTGNQIGALIVNFICETQNISNTSTIVATVVTSDFGKVIARANGVKVVETLTGFKFIGEKIKEYENSLENEFVFGYEESYGYLAGTFVRDKDAVIASMIIATMFEYYKSKNLSLKDILDNLYKRYGYFYDSLLTFKMNIDEIPQILSNFKSFDSIKTIFNDVVFYENFNESIRYFMEKVETIDLPQTNLIKIYFKDSSWVAIRGSGTEPKLKVYICARSNFVYKDINEKILELINKYTAFNPNN